MDANTVMNLITSVGFPIVACLFMAYYVKYITDQNKLEITNISIAHKEEITKITEALNNNTLAIQKICVLLNKDEKIEEE